MRLDLPIAVCLDVPSAIAIPPVNMVGRLVLEQLFRTALRGARIEVQTHSWGELNRADFLIEVTDRVQALRVVKEQLDALSLSGFAVLGWFDPDEWIWRSWHPHTGVRFDPEKRTREHAMMTEAVKRISNGESVEEILRNGSE